MLKFMTTRWKKLQRSVDRKILWPEFKSLAPSLSSARQIMLDHASLDVAYNDLNEEELAEYVNNLY